MSAAERPRVSRRRGGTAAAAGEGPVIPRATYRLQLNAGFTFRDATAIVPYLAALGVSHVYCSPYFRARSGSAHGYDVVDHNSFNPEIGDPNDFECLVAALRAHEMGHIVDIVPNHVGILGTDNAWWMDLLENGESSVYAGFFDIDWAPPNPDRAHKVLVPVLADPYATALERGELELRFERDLGSFAVFYGPHRLPLDPRTYPRVLDRVAALVSSSELENIRRAFAALPERRAPSVEQVAERSREKEAHKRRLAALAARDSAVATALDVAVRSFTGTAAEPASFDALHELLELQAFHLAYWRVASEDINYRRFFDVNDLAALRVENEAVFELTHRLVLQLIGAGKIDGLRIDHVDGLHDPAGYLRRLQRRIGEVTGNAWRRSLYLVVEKISLSFEHLPEEWPVHGETGYHFANVVNRMLIDAATRTRMDRVYRTIGGDSLDWRDVAYDCQQLILRRSLASELNVATNQLARIARSDRSTRDFTFNNLRQALAEVIACFPVYRTYIADTVADSDRRYIDWAIAAARRRRAASEAPVFDFVRAALLLQLPAATEAQLRAHRAFVMKFQQITAPITAKGIEDTALYRYNRLLALNEVGGEPGNYGGGGVRAFHADAEYRGRHWPHEMLATSTHDTKRSEDVRARLAVLSEMTTPWRDAVRRWMRINRTRKREVDGAAAPCSNDEYHFYQTLVGSWPLLEPDAAGMAEYRARIEAYMIKAVREAKAHTSWTDTGAAYEDALLQFVHSALEPRDNNLFLADFLAFWRPVARFGLLNSLSQTLCKLTAPGVPDIYQGNELWDFSLVDPDNRRPVDYRRRGELLAQLDREAARLPIEEVLEHMEDGRCKLLLTWRALQLRQAHPLLFSDGDYRRLRAHGSRAHYLCAFARRSAGRTVVVIAPRLYRRLLGDPARLPLGSAVWENTLIELPPDAGSRGLLRNVLDGTELQMVSHGETLAIPAAQALARFPVALLSGGEDLPLSGSRAPAV
ncbi:MAG TPA: malto-oligosyltrehalose synthase [Steroidobacteraceae bacterium]|nr:malto-oligosyltrehalose synthase [Steroidobacteraceae bacterium]